MKLQDIAICHVSRKGHHLGWRWKGWFYLRDDGGARIEKYGDVHLDWWRLEFEEDGLAVKLGGFKTFTAAREYDKRRMATKADRTDKVRFVNTKLCPDLFTWRY